MAEQLTKKLKSFLEVWQQLFLIRIVHRNAQKMTISQEVWLGAADAHVYHVPDHVLLKIGF